MKHSFKKSIALFVLSFAFLFAVTSCSKEHILPQNNDYVNQAAAQNQQPQETVSLSVSKGSEHDEPLFSKKSEVKFRSKSGSDVTLVKTGKNAVSVTSNHPKFASVGGTVTVTGSGTDVTNFKMPSWIEIIDIIIGQLPKSSSDGCRPTSTITIKPDGTVVVTTTGCVAI